eukprot:CAMPEP_0204279378 /NCGR_PEP_ID=MMETSP0468-20130131/35010_1 /ASSEMBLY_ACC=CAM_ASM_000383 /TAXON_ID=2969 /ORGANISM="Oxyrrhis marina" /LENGTH=78 /DNA_ID=CAMNT_0051256465 /DNA_START=366 /DNA_END=602 /DNA_ORIENTATION=-
MKIKGPTATARARLHRCLHGQVPAVDNGDQQSTRGLHGLSQRDKPPLLAQPSVVEPIVNDIRQPHDHKNHQVPARKAK